jgi:hypothetical protein
MVSRVAEHEWIKKENNFNLLFVSSKNILTFAHSF